MSWESRPGTTRRYYTRSRKVNGQIIREYVGTGAQAEHAAAGDHAQRQRRRTTHRQRQAEAQAWNVLVDQSAAVARVCGEVFIATLVTAGYHQHARGEWRRRRG